MLVSIGLALFLRYLYQIIFGAGTQSYRQYTTQEGDRLRSAEPAGQVVLRHGDLCSPRCSPSGSGCSGRGSAPRSARSPTSATSRRRRGIDVRRVILAVWIAGAGLAALGGILLGVSQGVQWNMGFRLLLTMFAAVVLGGLGSAFGAMAGGLIVGIASEVSTYWIEPRLQVRDRAR